MSCAPAPPLGWVGSSPPLGRRRRSRQTVCLTGSGAPEPDAAEPGSAEWRTGKVRAKRPGRRPGYRYDWNQPSKSGSGSSGGVGPVKTQGRDYDRAMAPPPQLRILGGTAKGRKLDSPEVYMRPMMGKVREALFSMLYTMDAIKAESRVLDLFSGSGGVGVEALSRGYGEAVFVDWSQTCVDAIDRNLEKCNFASRGRAICAKMEDIVSEPDRFGLYEPFQLITVTPPYEEVDYGELLTLIGSSKLVGEGTFVVIEYPIELKTLPPAIMQRLVGLRNRKYGRTVMAVYACQPDIDLEPRPNEFIKPV